MAKKQTKFLIQQKAALGAFAALLIGIAGYLIWMTQEGTPAADGFVEGEHYQVLENPRRIRNDKVEVMEFFSYGCVHCYNFDPLLHDWAQSRSEKVDFVRTPAIANDYWRVLGRAYYTLQEMGELDNHHTSLFRAIHESRDNLSNPEALFDWAESDGLDREKFASTYRSTVVNSAMNRADQMARRLQVATVPSIIVQGKYLVRATRSIGQNRMLDVMDYLVELEQDPSPATQE